MASVTPTTREGCGAFLSRGAPGGHVKHYYIVLDYSLVWHGNCFCFLIAKRHGFDILPKHEIDTEPIVLHHLHQEQHQQQNNC